MLLTLASAMVACGQAVIVICHAHHASAIVANPGSLRDLKTVESRIEILILHT
jgi:hypothetical protein